MPATIFWITRCSASSISTAVASLIQSLLEHRAPNKRLPVGCSLYAVGERSLFHTLRNAPSVMGRAPAKRKTISPTMRSHSSLW